MSVLPKSAKIGTNIKVGMTIMFWFATRITEKISFIAKTEIIAMVVLKIKEQFCPEISTMSAKSAPTTPETILLFIFKHPQIFVNEKNTHLWHRQSFFPKNQAIKYR